MVVALMVPIFSLLQGRFGPFGIAACPIYPTFNGQTGQLLENNVFQLEYLDQVPRAPISPNRWMLNSTIDLTPQERAEPVVIYSIACLMFSGTSFVFLLLANPLFLCTFWAGELCNTILVAL